MSALKPLVRRSVMFIVVWCAMGALIAGLAGLEVLYWKDRGCQFSSKSTTESTVVRDFSTNRCGQSIAKIIGHRTRDAANPLSVEVVLEGTGNNSQKIQFEDSTTPYRIALSENNEVAILMRDGQVYLGDLDRGITRLSEPLYSNTLEPTLTDLDFSGDGRFLASQSKNGPVVWDAQSRRQISKSWPKDRSRFLCFFHDSHRILEAANSGVRIRDVLTGKVSNTIRTDFAASAAALSPNGELALLCSGGFEVRMWNLTQGVELWRANSRALRRTHLAMSNEQSFYMATHSRDVMCCDATTGLEEKVALSHVHSIHGMKLLDNMELLSWDVLGALHRSRLSLSPVPIL